MLLAVLAGHAPAQVNLPFGPENYSHDFQLFAPVEIDLDNEPSVDDHGYVANYSKLAWSYIGEQEQIGDPDVVVFSEEIYRDNGAPTDFGSPPPPYVIKNGLQDVFPKAGFALGDRYEIGYRDRGNGWMIGILDGPDLRQSKVYGMGPTPVPDPEYNGPVVGPWFAPMGFGNVHVNFATPVGYLQGFRDYLNLFAGAAIGTQVGPIAYVGNYGGVDEPDADDDGTINFVRITDDINENGIFGAAIVIVVGPDGVARISTLTDFGDLHTFNIAFDSVTVRTRTKTDGVEAMWSHELTNRHYQAKHQNNHFELGAGARFMQLKDFFGVAGEGSILGDTFFDTWMNNQIVGPQVRAAWTNQRQRWRFKADTRFMFGYNIQNWHQENGVGMSLVPGATNRPLYAQPTYSTHGVRKDNFAPVGELRLETAYYLTQNLTLKLGYTGMYLGNIRRAATSVKYYLPDMGYQESGTQDFISNGADFGIEFVY